MAAPNGGIDGPPKGTGGLFQCAVCGGLVYESQLEYHMTRCKDPEEEAAEKAAAEKAGAQADGDAMTGKQEQQEVASTLKEPVEGGVRTEYEAGSARGQVLHSEAPSPGDGQVLLHQSSQGHIKQISTTSSNNCAPSGAEEGYHDLHHGENRQETSTTRPPLMLQHPTKIVKTSIVDVVGGSSSSKGATNSKSTTNSTSNNMSSTRGPPPVRSELIDPNNLSPEQERQHNQELSNIEDFLIASTQSASGPRSTQKVQSQKDHTRRRLSEHPIVSARAQESMAASEGLRPAEGHTIPQH
ncbi:unnamed protein product [Amoebophrya sp. A25]|nr:unnamed protein product [Amoebophrya sp. A25]|eukprot:GSA25T00019375001.1